MGITEEIEAQRRKGSQVMKSPEKKIEALNDDVRKMAESVRKQYGYGDNTYKNLMETLNGMKTNQQRKDALNFMLTNKSAAMEFKKKNMNANESMIENLRKMEEAKLITSAQEKQLEKMVGKVPHYYVVEEVVKTLGKSKKLSKDDVENYLKGVIPFSEKAKNDPAKLLEGITKDAKRREKEVPVRVDIGGTHGYTWNVKKTTPKPKPVKPVVKEEKPKEKELTQEEMIKIAKERAAEKAKAEEKKEMKVEAPKEEMEVPEDKVAPKEAPIPETELENINVKPKDGVNPITLEPLENDTMPLDQLSKDRTDEVDKIKDSVKGYDKDIYWYDVVLVVPAIWKWFTRKEDPGKSEKLQNEEIAKMDAHINDSIKDSGVQLRDGNFYAVPKPA